MEDFELDGDFDDSIFETKETKREEFLAQNGLTENDIYVDESGMEFFYDGVDEDISASNDKIYLPEEIQY